MKQTFQILSLAGAILVMAPRSVPAQSGETPTYSNAEVVSIDPLRRVAVLRTPQGATESLIFDDLLTGTGNAKAGDRVIVTVRGGPGRRRLSAISVMPQRPTSPPTVTVQQPARPTTAAVTARTRYAGQVEALSRQADLVDATWRSFVDGCAVKPVSNENGGRDWFRLWDSPVQADYSGGRCRDLFNQIVSTGEDIKKRMATLEEDAEKTMNPGEIREVRRTYSMNWDGWKLPAPPRREP